MDGDTIATHSSPATLSFPDGSRITLGPSSKASVQKVNDKIAFRLIAGSSKYELQENSMVAMYRGAATEAPEPLPDPAPAPAPQSSPGAGAGGGGISTGMKVLIGAMVVGAGVGLGFAVGDSGSSPDPSISPRR